jgi:hypothetical protein
MSEMLQEEKEVSAADLKVKVQKLDGFVKRAERRIATLEKKLAKYDENMRLQGGLSAKKVVA